MTTAFSTKPAPFDPSSLSKWHDPAKLRQRGGLFRPSRENPLIGLLLAIPKRDGANRQKERNASATPRSKKGTPKLRGSSRKGRPRTGEAGPSSDNEAGRYAPPSSPLHARSTFNRKSLVAQLNELDEQQPLLPGNASSDADFDKPSTSRKRKRRTPSRKAASKEPSESQDEGPAIMSARNRASGRVRLSDIARGTSEPAIENPVSSVQPTAKRRHLYPIAESLPPEPELPVVPKGKAKQKGRPAAAVVNIKQLQDKEVANPTKVKAAPPRKRKQPDTEVDEDQAVDVDFPSPPKRARNAPTASKTKTSTAAASRKAKPKLPPPIPSSPAFVPTIKKSSKTRIIAELSDDDDDAPLVSITKPKGKPKAGKQGNVPPAAEPAAAKPKAASKKTAAKAKATTSRQKAQEDTDDDAENMEQPPAPRKRAPAATKSAAQKQKAAPAPRKRKKVVPLSASEDEIETKKTKAPVKLGNADQMIPVKFRSPAKAQAEAKTKARLAPPRKSYFARALPKEGDDDRDPLDLFG